MKKYLTIYVFFVCAVICACKQKAASDDDSGGTDNVVTPVTITHPSTGNMNETVQIDAVSSFLLKTYAKANANGYLQAVNVHLGQFVNRGEVLFVIKTKEAEALGNTITSLDTSLHFMGTISIRSPGTGFITQLTYTAGNYVQDGEALAEITDTKSFVFLLDLPYELKPYLPGNKTLELHLPDSSVLTGYLESSLPTIDSADQTQRFIIKVNTDKNIPANLIAKVNLVKSEKTNTVSLPRPAVLTDETESQFWVMKMINDSTAVKLPVTKGLQTKTDIEILSPHLSASDSILLTGNYGLSDTAKVQIVKE